MKGYNIVCPSTFSLWCSFPSVLQQPSWNSPLFFLFQLILHGAPRLVFLKQALFLTHLVLTAVPTSLASSFQTALCPTFSSLFCSQKPHQIMSAAGSQ